jgi:CheY-like chemotaxis protein
MRLLLVDDNAINLELFNDALTSDGHEVVTESDPLRGQQRALAEPFDVIILDIQMPGSDGYAVCRALRGSGHRGPIVALSSNALPDHVAEGMRAGFDSYLTKPISPAELRAAVRRLGRAA